MLQLKSRLSTAFTLHLCKNFQKNFFSSLSGYAIKYKEYGDPNSVLEKVEESISEDLQSNQVLLKMLAAPINPADINMIQGKYAVKPSLPAIGGNEGVAEVIKVGSSVKQLNVGSWVIPISAGWGTWRTHVVCDENELTKIDETLPIATAATISVNPCTAFRMLKDFENLKEGDTVIQNGANSAVGQAVIQIAKYLKIKSINIVRDRENLDELKTYLSSLGADYIVTENEIRTPVMTNILKDIPKPKLGLNCVGGKSAAEVIRHMAHQGTLVTYGGMSKLPLTVSTASLIFNDIRLYGFWMTQWNKVHSLEERGEMLSNIIDIIKKGCFKPPMCNEVRFEDFNAAVTKSMEPFISKKQILIF